MFVMSAMTPRRAGLRWVLALLIVVLVSAQAHAQGRGRGQQAESSLKVIVDAVVRNTWNDADLKRLAESNEGPKWKNKGKQEVTTVSVWALLKEADVTRDAIKKVEMHSRGKVLVRVEADDLARLDQLVLRKAPRPDRPWKLGGIAPGNRHPYGQPVIQRIEVTTTAAAK